MAGQPVSIKVKKTGRFKAPNLDNGALTDMGNQLVAAQKARWAKGLNTSDSPAAPLSKPYLYKKAKYRRTNRPVRDLHLTGLLLGNFTLRKAANGIIRAEPTSREGRKHATSGNEKDQMIGFAGSDVKVACDEAQAKYGKFAKEMWIPIG